MRQKLNRTLMWSSLFIASAQLVPAALGQIRFNGAEAIIPDTSNKPSVYVRDSAVAAEKLALAQRMEHLKEWNKSADVYQEIVEKYADRVVPVDNTSDPAKATRYMSVTMQVQSLIGKWPAEGLQVYRSRFETPAATLLESANGEDIAILNRVVQIYFPTDAAKQAGLRLMDLYIEDGEFAAAGWLGERLLAAHPSLGADRANVLFRTALAEHLGGNDIAAKAKVEELKQTFAAATGTVMGKDVVLADAAAKILASPAPVARGVAAESWPMVGGDATRGRVPEAAGRPGAKIAEITLQRKKYLPNPAGQMANDLNARRKERREFGLSLGLMPVVDHGEIFYQDGGRIYGASVDSGLPLAGWSTPGTADNDKRFSDQPSFLPPTQQTSVTVTDSSVLGIIGQTQRSVVINELGQQMISGGETQLLCLDRATGAKRWSASPSNFPDALANLKGLQFNGSPLVIGDTVYVGARGGKAMQFEDAYVVAFSMTDGRLRWACYLASGNAPGGDFGMPVVPSESLTHISYAGGRVYAVTNLGAVAAVDAYTGTIAWLSIYPTHPQINNPMMAFNAMNAGGVGGLGRARKPWAQNPTIVKEGKVFALPSDSASLLIYDAGSGEEVKRIALSDFDNADTLLGVVDEKLVIGGPNSVFCINWPAYDAGKSRDDNLLWWKPFASPGSTEADAKDVIRGRGFLTTDSLFMPTKTGLNRISLNGGKSLETYPHGASWPSGEGPGNVVVTQDQVIIAGVDSIIVYSDLALARAKLDKAITDAPNDASPRLKYAETLFAAGQMDDAVAKLDEAITLLGGINSMRPGADRDRVFARSLTFAERLADPKIGVRDMDRVSSLYDRAAAAASSPQQQVTWRISRAKFSRDRQDFATEVKLYQDILSDAALRGVTVPSEDQTGVQMASVYAESAIDYRLKAALAAYAPFEQAAKDALMTARQANDATLMLAVAQTYPNSTVAVDAMFAAADAYEAAGKNRPARQVLDQLYRKYRDRADKPRILEAQARNSLPLPGGLDVAIGRLTEGAKLGGPQLTKPLKLPDGNTIENVTFGAAAELLQKYSMTISNASLPEFNIPVWKGSYKPKTFLAETANMVIADVDEIVLPPRDLRKFSRYDRVVTWTKGKGINIFAVGTNTPLASSSAILSPPRGGVWLGNDLLVWSIDKLALLRGDTGATAWQTDVSALPPVEIAAAGEDVAVAPPENNQPRRFGFGRRGRIIADNQIIQLPNGQVIVPNGQPFAVGAGPVGRRAAGGGETLDHVRPVGDRVIIATSSGRISALELGTGQIAWQARVSDAPFNMVVNSDDYLAARFQDDFGSQIVALETFTGQVVWKHAFVPENGQVPVNMTLAPDGTLLFTLPDQLCGVDLYEPGKDLKFGDKNPPDGTMPFAGALGPDQLIATNGQVLAVADGGRYVRVLSADNGKLMGQPLSTGANNWNVSLRVVGPRLYVINSHAAMGYSLDHPEESWSGQVDPEEAVVRDAFVGKRHLVLLGQPDAGQAGEGVSTAAGRFKLLAYGRYPQSESQSGEVGRLDQTPTVSNAAGIEANQWQPVEGGFYYRSIDRQAHFLKGAATGG